VTGASGRSTKASTAEPTEPFSSHRIRRSWTAATIRDLGPLTGGERVLISTNVEHLARAQLEELARVPHVTFFLVEDDASNFMRLDSSLAWPDNVWLGFRAQGRTNGYGLTRLLRADGPRHRFALCDPLLEALDLRPLLSIRGDATCVAHGTTDCSKCHAALLPDWLSGRLLERERPRAGRLARLEWVVAGPSRALRGTLAEPAWFRAIRDACVLAGVPFWFQGWGAWRPASVAFALPGADLPQPDPDAARAAFWKVAAAAARHSSLTRHDLGDANFVQEPGGWRFGPTIMVRSDKGQPSLLDGERWHQSPAALMNGHRHGSDQ
jgi:protein gp37